MDFGAWDEEIGQELTEGGAFCDVAPDVFFFDCARWMQIPSFMEKTPNNVQTAVADRSCWVLEMDLGAWDEEIGQELTEGGAFCDVAPAVFFPLRALDANPLLYGKNRPPTFKPLLLIALVESWRWILALEMRKLDKNWLRGGISCDVVPLYFFDRARWMQIPSFMEKPPNNVQTTVAGRSRRVLEMNFGAWDEEIGQELTEGGDKLWCGATEFFRLRALDANPLLYGNTAGRRSNRCRRSLSSSLGDGFWRLRWGNRTRIDWGGGFLWCGTGSIFFFLIARAGCKSPP
jgi:hypothetical protein